jgi:hypothetical protein
MPWLSMIIIEENVAAIITFFLQLSLIGWIPAAFWACSLLKKHLKAEELAKTSSSQNTSTNTNVNKDHG